MNLDCVLWICVFRFFSFVGLGVLGVDVFAKIAGVRMNPLRIQEVGVR